MADAPAPHTTDGNVIETIQSLIVAFVLAMTFRGFVTEGFVIPTGSMAPTLLGQHTLIHSQQTGTTFAVGMDGLDPRRSDNIQRVTDPMLGPQYPGSGVPRVKRAKGMGDRILVLKALYPFTAPKRFDVVVFKNPTDPTGDAANYIKRLIGLPDEQIWLTDGDVFAKNLSAVSEQSSETTDNSQPATGNLFQIQRKPEHVQRAVWQMVYHSDHAPMQPDRLTQRYSGPPWQGDRAAWDTSAGSYHCITSERTVLRWENARRAITDWTPYNMLLPSDAMSLSDVRISAGIVAQQAGLKTILELQARSHVFQFIIDAGQGNTATATLRMRPREGLPATKSPAISDRLSDDAANGQLTTDNSSPVTERSATISLPAPGKVFNVEFWHADQSMQLFIDGKRVGEPLEYDWTPMQRLQYASGDLLNDDVETLISSPAQHAQIRWHFEGSPVTLHRVRLDRDLYYRHAVLVPSRGHPPLIAGHGFGTHPTSPKDYPGILGPDQFMMCGDNSQMSLDSRLWGSPHPLIASQIDPHPFTVNRKLLVGKAWVVYFPAPYPITDGGMGVVPDFGRLRFIR